MTSRSGYWMTFLLTAAATVGVLLLMQNIFKHQREAEQIVFKIAEVDESTIDPAVWGRNFPRQYDGYKRTVDIERTRFGGSEAFSKLEQDARWKLLFNGYAFSVDYREERGHAYMLVDQEQTDRVTKFKQPGACLHCHASVIPAYRKAGLESGVAPAPGFNWPAVHAGFQKICAMPYGEARKLVDHPVSCVDCHDPQSMQLRVTRPGFHNGIRALAAGDAPTPHLPSIERWRAEGRKGEYDPNLHASRQEMRSFICGQCHVEYYFKGDAKLLTYPWHNGLKVEQIEKYYDAVGHMDWSHTNTAAPILKAQHPEFELWSQGIHARSGVACADCHMPYTREGAIKVSDHHVRSPMLNVARSCQVCHRFPEEEIKSRVLAIQDRTEKLMVRAEEAAVDLIKQIEAAMKAGATDEQLKPARQFHRQAEWRLDFIAAENSMGFHAPQEAARILGEAIDFARQGQIQVLRSASNARAAAQ